MRKQAADGIRIEQQLPGVTSMVFPPASECCGMTACVSKGNPTGTNRNESVGAHPATELFLVNEM